jgi:hypothetical protein
MTPAEIIADRIRGVCTVDPADVAEAIVSRLEAEGWRLQRTSTPLVLNISTERPTLEQAREIKYWWLGERPGRPHHGDRWENRNGRAVVVASNDWPPPAPGTHESDLRFTVPQGWDLWHTGKQYADARRWSYESQRKEHA